MSMQLPHHWVNTNKLAQSGLKLHLAIDKDSAPALAQAIGVEQILSLTANLVVKPANGAGVRVSGAFKASIMQNCVATLQPIENLVTDEFQRWFVPENARHSADPRIIDGEIVLDPDADDLPDVYTANRLDLWEVLVEQLVLAVDLFPRIPAAKIDENDESNRPETLKTHKPFAKLKALITEKNHNKPD